MLQRKLALVVDDEVFARLFATQILLDEGFFAIEAASSREALDVLCENEDAAVLLTDVSMPGEMDGIALAQKVAETHPHVTIIVVSGRVQPSSEDLPAGAKFLAKPYTAHGLMSIIREVSG